EDVVGVNFIRAEVLADALHCEPCANHVLAVGFARSHNVPVGLVKRGVVIVLLGCCDSASRAFQRYAHFPGYLMQSMRQHLESYRVDISDQGHIYGSPKEILTFKNSSIAALSFGLMTMVVIGVSTMAGPRISVP